MTASPLRQFASRSLTAYRAAQGPRAIPAVSPSNPGTVATIFGVLTVLIAASGVSGEMHTVLNMTFKAKPSDEPISSLMRPRREPGSRHRARLRAGSVAGCQRRAVSVRQVFQGPFAGKILLTVLNTVAFS
jgi:membrane protein